MTPAEHLAEAERLLGLATDQRTVATGDEQRFWVQLAKGHTLIAVAAELGVPHGGTGVNDAQGKAQAAAG